MWSKIELRKINKEIRTNMSKDECLRLSKIITDNLVNLECIKSAKHILLYSSIQNEVDVSSLIYYCQINHKKVYLPKTYSNEIQFYEISDFQNLSEGMFHVLEPTDLSKKYQGQEGVIIVPGLAFNRCRQRIGFGKGYYDRFLIKHENLYSIGVGYKFQMIEDFEADHHDVPLNLLVSELGEI